MKPDFELRISRPSRPCSPFNQGTNQCRSRTGQVANFAKRDNSILIYTPTVAVLILNLIDCTRYIFLKEHFQNLCMKQKLMLLHIIISSDNFKTNERFLIMKIKLFLKTILGQNNFMSVCY